MAVTTLTQFVAALTAMSVTGVTRAYTNPPNQVNTADLPCSYARLPQVDSTPTVSATGNHPWPRFTAEYVILAEAVGQNRQPTNFALVLTLIDNLQAALKAVDLAKTPATWTIRQEIVQTNESTFHWALIAQVTANG